MSDVGIPASGLAGSVVNMPEAPTRGAPPDRREASPAGTWKVGSLRPTTVKVLTFVGFAIPVGAYLFLVVHYQVNAIWTDQWGDVHVLVQNAGRFPNWSSLWALHTDNRVFFPNLIVIGLAHTVSFNIEVEEILSALMLFAATGLLIWAHKRRSPAIPLLYYCPVAFVMLTFAQSQDSLWGFQMAWYLVLLALAVSVVLLDRPQMAWPILVGAIAAAVVGSYSSLQGLLIWPVGLVLLYHRRRSTGAFVTWIAAGLLTVGLYFYNFNAARTVSPFWALEHPLWSAKLVLFALGDVVGMQTSHGPVSASLLLGRSDSAITTPGNAAVLLFGVVILALAIFVVVKWGIRRDTATGAPLGVALIVYGVLFAALVTDGRVLLDYWGVSQPRYATFDVLVLVGMYLVTLSRATGPERATRATPGRIVAWVVLAAMAIQVVFGVHYGVAGARAQIEREVAATATARDVDHESWVTVYLLDIGQTPQELRQDVAFVREHHLGPFG
jgi:hypothetical protein